MNAAELRSLSADELEQRIRSDEDELLRLRFQSATGVLQNPIRIRVLRREIARAKTIQCERQVAVR